VPDPNVRSSGTLGTGRMVSGRKTRGFQDNGAIARKKSWHTNCPLAPGFQPVYSRHPSQQLADRNQQPVDVVNGFGQQRIFRQNVQTGLGSARTRSARPGHDPKEIRTMPGMAPSRGPARPDSTALSSPPKAYRPAYQPTRLPLILTLSV